MDLRCEPQAEPQPEPSPPSGPVQQGGSAPLSGLSPLTAPDAGAIGAAFAPAPRPVEAAPFEIGNVTVAPGERRTVELPVADLYTRAPVHLPVIVHHGRLPGPRVFVSAALHGDEIIGIEVIRRLLKLPELDALAGTLLAVPVVNVLGFLHQSRYLPDRRDLNRSFPGSESGSLTARLAFQFLHGVVRGCDLGIDLHTGAIRRPNLPQIRADLSQPRIRELAEAFGAPLLLNSAPAPGTLREFAMKEGIPILLYESSEALRFDETCIRIGMQGVLNVLTAMGMLPADPAARPPARPPMVARSSQWCRAPSSGILRTQVRLGDEVRKGDVLGLVGDPFGINEIEVTANHSGFVIGMVDLPLVYEGDALFHIARIEGHRHPADDDVPRARIDVADFEVPTRLEGDMSPADLQPGDEVLPGADDRT